MLSGWHLPEQGLLEEEVGLCGRLEVVMKDQVMKVIWCFLPTIATLGNYL